MAQNGAFIMAPLIKKDAPSHFLYANQIYIMNEMEAAFEKKVIITGSAKRTMLKELDYLGFNKATIFTDMTNKLQYLNEKEISNGRTIDLS